MIERQSVCARCSLKAMIQNLNFTEIPNVNAGDVIDNNSSNESGLHLDSDRPINEHT